MFGSSTLIDPQTRSRPSDSQGNPGLSIDSEQGKATRTLWALRMIENASEELSEAIQYARYEEEPTPSGLASACAESHFRQMATRLARECPSGHRPVMTCSVGEAGEIEIVGYFTGIVGRYTVRIGPRGEYEDLMVSGWGWRK